MPSTSAMTGSIEDMSLPPAAAAFAGVRGAAGDFDGVDLAGDEAAGDDLAGEAARRALADGGSRVVCAACEYGEDGSVLEGVRRERLPLAGAQ